VTLDRPADPVTGSLRAAILCSRYPRWTVVTSLLAGFDLAEPGVVHASQWRPDAVEDHDEHPERSRVYVAVGRKA
jgi:S-adenosyl methyltransferase